MGWIAGTVGRTGIVVLLVALAGCGSEPTNTSTGTTSPPPASPTQTATVTPTESPSESATCETFGSTADQSSADPLALSSLTGASMRVGRHDCFERFVFEMTGTGENPGWRVGYADPMGAQGSGDPVELAGDADLEVIVGVWTVSDFEGRPDEWPPFQGPDDLVTTGFTAIKEARNLYAFEGMTQIGLGLDKKRPFRVTWEQGPPRLVVDVYTG